MESQDSGERKIAAPNIFDIYKDVEYLSIKHDSYFQVYDEIFRPFVGKTFTFVEVGVLNGGSLFMWRKYFGPGARIIGIDMNPGAERWRDHGFEIAIGDQSEEQFWDEFYRKYGPVDVLLDDGGHTNDQQVLTTHKALENVRSGGLVVVEDVHTSYQRPFGNPSRYSFISFAKHIVDSVNSRFPNVNVAKNNYGKRVFSVSFYESIVVFKIDTDKAFVCKPTSNKGKSVNADDFRYRGSFMWGIDKIHERTQKNIARLFKNAPSAKSTLSRICSALYWRVCFLFNRVKTRRVKKLFR